VRSDSLSRNAEVPFPGNVPPGREVRAGGVRPRAAIPRPTASTPASRRRGFAATTIVAALPLLLGK